jgi:hypothetical protein
MATKQQLYTGALYAIGQRKFLTTESHESRRALDDVYDAVIAECLEAGSWNFAMETVKLAADTGVTPNFGYTEVFAKPSDWIRTYGISGDEYLRHPLLQYYDDSNYLSADSTPIYLRYVSNDTGLGLDLTRWPASFTRYVELELASRVCFRLTQDKALTGDVMDMRDKARRRALNKDAMDEPGAKFKPAGSWTSSRYSRSGWGDRGSRNNLTG